MRKLTAEFVGTYFLLFCGCGAIVINQVSDGVITHMGIAITFGLIIMCLIYALGDISGAHFNPAVSIAFTVAGKFPKSDLVPYIISQILGAVAAAFTLKILFPTNQLLGSTIPAGSALQSFFLEILLTLLLMLVIIRVAHGSKEVGLFAGVAIGATVGLDAMFGGPISGASMNPARSIGPALASGHLEHLWVYLLAPVIGAILAIYLNNYLIKKIK
ncbi:MAG: MIP family channel protein [Saprospiraceae bacterium]|nr:MIP family channel protein [Saprospiraceae bacterium]